MELTRLDLYRMACSIGYTMDSAFRLADDSGDRRYVESPCPTHPHLSTVIDQQGFGIDECEACKVIKLCGGVVPAVFDETEPATWQEWNLPAGYEWRCVDVEEGQFDLFAVDGRNVSQMMRNLAVECQDGKCATCDACLSLGDVAEAGLDVFAEAMAEAERDEATAAEVNEGCRELAAEERAIRTPGTVLVDMTDGYSIKVARVENAGAADELVIFTNGESLFFYRLIVMVRTERMRIDSVPTDRAEFDEEQLSVSVDVESVVVGLEAVRRVAEHTRLMAYRVAARHRGKMQLTRVFTATVKGFNADYGQECRTWAQVEKVVAGLIAQHRGARS